ncbi:MAG TPA: hypothetical protein VGY56_00390 [Verrucomicrobiae bacterium]|nr:hypothetical protein [Verrucomicrobiae bacterium]
MSKLKIFLIVVFLAQKIWAAAGQTEIATPVELQNILTTNRQGAVVSLCGVAPESCPRIPVSQTFSGGKLIFSDSPESPTNVGILCMDTNLAATGPSIPNRIFVYHVNASSSGKMKFCVLVENNGNSAAVLTVHRAGVAGPGTDYMLIGETALNRWLANSRTTAHSVAPGQTIRLDTNFDSINVAHDGLLNGIWDYTFDQPHTIIICVLHANDDPIAVGPTLGVLAGHVHDRGTFEYCNKDCSTTDGNINLASAPREFPIGGNDDIYVKGWDNSVFPPIAVTNEGNYGVFYTVNLKLNADDSGALALLLSPQGGSWCGAVKAMPGLLPGGMFFVPSNQKSISDPSSAVIVGEYFPRVLKNISFQFMPSGGASFPVYVLTVPFPK